MKTLRFQIIVKKHPFSKGAFDATFEHAETKEKAIENFKRSFFDYELEQMEVDAVSTEKETVKFSWEFEDVGDKVVRNVSVRIEGKMIDCSEIEALQYLHDIVIDCGISKARNFVKKWAKENGYSFESEPADMYSYRLALIECANRNK